MGYLCAEFRGCADSCERVEDCSSELGRLMSCLMEILYLADVQSMLTVDISEATMAFTVGRSPLTDSSQPRVIVLFSCFNVQTASPFPISNAHGLCHLPDQRLTKEHRRCLKMSTCRSQLARLTVFRAHPQNWLLANILSDRPSLTALLSQSLRPCISTSFLAG